MSNIRAFKVTTDSAEVSVIAFADTPASAKRMAHGTDWLANDEWTDLRATRLPEADQFSEGRLEILDGSGPRSARVMWLVGWHQIDGVYEPCSKCGKHEWQDVPESKLTYKSDNDEKPLCALCVSEQPA